MIHKSSTTLEYDMKPKHWFIISGILGSTIGVPGVIQAAPLGGVTFISICIWVGAGKLATDLIRLVKPDFLR